MEPIKDILTEIVNDLEQVRVAIARRVTKPGEEAKEAGLNLRDLNRPDYESLRKRIDALKNDG